MEFLRRNRGYNFNEILSNKSAITRINRIVHVARGPIIMTTSGGEYSSVLPHLVQRAANQRIPLIFVDTLHYTKPTYDMIDYFIAQGFDIHTYKSQYTQEEMEERHPGWWNDQDESFNKDVFDKVVRMIKHEPLERAINEVQPEIWLSGLTRFKSKERQNKQLIEYNAKEIAKIHPIMDWEMDAVEDYMQWHSLPRNEHHFDITKGLSQKSECGIHTTFGE